MVGYTRGGLTPPNRAAGGQGGLTGSRRDRDSLFVLARVRLGEARDWAEVRVRNLSAGGLMAEIGDSAAIDTPVELELRGIGRVTGRVAWQAEGRTGVAFDAEIDPIRARKPVGTGKTTPPYGKPLTPVR